MVKLKKRTDSSQRMWFPQRHSIEGYLNGQAETIEHNCVFYQLVVSLYPGMEKPCCNVVTVFGTRGGERGACSSHRFRSLISESWRCAEDSHNFTINFLLR